MNRIHVPHTTLSTKLHSKRALVTNDETCKGQPCKMLWTILVIRPRRMISAIITKILNT